MLKDTLESLGAERIEEQSIETKEVTVKLKFTFVDGAIEDEEQAAIYEMITPKNDIIDEVINEEEQLADFNNENQY